MSDEKTRGDSLRYYLSGADEDGGAQEEHDITAVNTGDDWFEIDGDETALISVGDTITVEGSTGNDGTYTVEAVALEAGDTRISVEENISDGTVDGSIILDDRQEWSLGGHRTGTEIDFLGISVSNAIANVTIHRASGINGTGTATLEATGNDELTYTPPGGSAGAAVTILENETKIIEGDNPSKWVRVTRTTDTNLSGTATLTLTEVLNNVIGFGNVSSAQAESGITQHRAIFIRNENENAAVEETRVSMRTIPGAVQQTTDSNQLGSSGSGTITTTGSYASWPARGGCHIKDSGGSTSEIVYYSSRTDTTLTVPEEGRGLLGTSAGEGSSTDTVNAVPLARIGIETPSSGEIQTIESETEAPTGITWTTALTPADGLEIGTLAENGGQYGIWIQYVIPAGAEAQALMLNILSVSAAAA